RHRSSVAWRKHTLRRRPPHHPPVRAHLRLERALLGLRTGRKLAARRDTTHRAPVGTSLRVQGAPRGLIGTRCELAAWRDATDGAAVRTDLRLRRAPDALVARPRVLHRHPGGVRLAVVRVRLAVAARSEE